MRSTGTAQPDRHPRGDRANEFHKQPVTRTS
jgi:hypothetical protein